MTRPVRPRHDKFNRQAAASLHLARLAQANQYGLTPDSKLNAVVAKYGAQSALGLTDAVRIE